jgi:DUF4097 and DUF4098 domain-containing protein YvlB
MTHVPFRASTTRLLSGLAAVGVSLLVTSDAKAAPLIDQRFENTKVTAFEFEGGSGDLQVRESADGVAWIRAERKAGDDNCKIVARVEGSTLKVEANSANVKLCRIDVEVKVPKQTEMSVAIGSGDAQIRDISGSLVFRSGSGDLEVNAEISKLEVSSGSGSIELKRISGNADVRTGSGDVSARFAALGEGGEVHVKTGSGDVELSFEKVPTKGEIEVRTGSGDVVTKVPRDARVRVDMMTGSGTVKDSLGRSEDAKLVLRLRTGSGDLVLTPN